MQWSIVKGIAGDAPPPIRAHTATAVGSAIYVFAGGDGTAYHVRPLSSFSPVQADRQADQAARSVPARRRTTSTSLTP